MSTISRNDNGDKKIKYTFISPRKQCFSLPPDVISSMLTLPNSSNGLLRLYKTCKYFYSKKQILVISFTRFEMESGYGYTNVGAELKIRYKDKIDVTNLHNLLWHYNKAVFEYYFNVNKRLPKFFRCSIKNLILYKSVIYYDDLIILSSEQKIQELDIRHESCIWDSNNKIVNLPDFLPLMPNLASLNCSYHATDYTDEVIEKLSFIQLKSKLNCLCLKISTSQFAENELNRNYLYKFIKNNVVQSWKSQIHLGYTDNSGEFLQEIIQKWRKQIPKVAL